MSDRRIEAAVQALRDIIDPIGQIRREMPEGHQLNGHYAVMLRDDPEHLRGIARQVLKKLRRVEKVKAR